MRIKKAIQWLEMYANRPVKWDDYSDESKAIREEAERQIVEAFKMAINALKAQEPRVMTATEAYTADYVYIEFDGVITPAIRTTNERDGHRESYFATQQLGGDWMRWGDYGITWRCWTSRPTDEQREATPWQNT